MYLGHPPYDKLLCGYIAKMPILRSKRSLLQLIFLTNRFCLNYGEYYSVFDLNHYSCKIFLYLCKVIFVIKIGVENEKIEIFKLV